MNLKGKSLFCGVVLAGAVAFSASVAVASGPMEASPTPPAAEATPLGDAPVRLAQAPMAKVSYTNEQADRGEDRYTKTCEDCHGEDLRGGLNGGAPLRGGKFEQDFGGAPASALFLFMSTQMPPGDPGRFSASVYADLMAYILKRNGYQPGAALPSDVDALDKLIVEK